MFDVTYDVGMLAVMVVSPNKARGHTKGLLGVFNGEADDDLLTRNGTVLPADSDIQTIHEQFGEPCKCLSVIILYCP